MWLNEGFTVFEENHVTALIDGEEFAKVEALLGRTDMMNDMRTFGFSSSYSSLTPQLNGHDPDDAFSDVPYEKGFAFLTYLEDLVGNNTMQGFLRAYINKYSLQSVNHTQMKDTFIDYITTTGHPANASDYLSQIDWDLWLFKAGPPNASLPALNFSTQAQVDAEKLAKEYILGEGKTSPAEHEKYHGYFSNQKVLFLLELVRQTPNVTYAIMQKLDADLNLTNTTNPEVK